MTVQPSTRLRHLLASTLILVMLGLSGCGAIKTLQASAIQRDESAHTDELERNTRPEAVIVSMAPFRLSRPPASTGGVEAVEEAPAYSSDPHYLRIRRASHAGVLVDEFGLMALFSTMVYHRHVPLENRYGEGDSARRGARQVACVDNHAGHPLPRLFPDTPVLGGGAQTGRWVRWLQGKEPACASADGLFYETYVLETLTDTGVPMITDAVIAFRGTENTPGQEFADWKDNFSAFFGIEPHQYRLAREKLKHSVAALLAANPSGVRPRIYVTGHSLGGGLAQLAVYAHPEVIAAYVFNTTAVTDWSFMKLEGAVKVSDPVIYRIEQRGEFLGNLRAITSRFNSRRYGRSDFEFNYQEEGGQIAKHSISLLACNFAARIAAVPGRKAAFGYDDQLAARAFKLDLQSTGEDSKRNLETLCGSKIRRQVCESSAVKDTAACRQQVSEK